MPVRTNVSKRRREIKNLLREALHIPERKHQGILQIREYLKKHYRYNTMHSWNRVTSYAHCIKVTRLGLPGETVDRLFDAISVEGFYSFSGFSDELEEFARRHDYEWRMGINGRSDGYIVLYQGTKGRPNLHSSTGTDENEDFEHWDRYSVEARFEVVWDFDQTTLRALIAGVLFAEKNKVEEITVNVPTKTMTFVEDS